ncbi:MAG: hypothetical protein AB7D33_03800 [Sphingobium sp.]
MAHAGADNPAVMPGEKVFAMFDGWTGKFERGLRRWLRRIDRQGVRLVTAAEQHIGRLALFWCLLLGVIVAARLAITATVDHDRGAWLLSASIYGLLLLSPLIGLFLAAQAFPRGQLFALPDIPIARFGMWRRVDPLTAHAHRSFGVSGLLVGFVIGLLINIVLRTAEFLSAVPSMAGVGPGWPQTLFLTLAADCILFNILYGAVFVMALRHVPWFPRVMLLIWLTDIVSQLYMARILGGQALPEGVADALVTLLGGNIRKSLISIALWLPYFLLSERVNITYRRRVRVEE